METLVIIKPDAIEKEVDGEIITRMRRRGCHLIRAELIVMTRRQANTLYEKFIGEPWAGDLCDFMVSGLSWVMIVDHRYENAIEVMRRMIGADTETPKLPGTIRGDFGESFRRNAIHASDCGPSAEREIRIFFPRFYDAE
jgi:nucleoside-diphosphate kinase